MAATPQKATATAETAKGTTQQTLKSAKSATKKAEPNHVREKAASTAHSTQNTAAGEGDEVESDFTEAYDASENEQQGPNGVARDNETEYEDGSVDERQDDEVDQNDSVSQAGKHTQDTAQSAGDEAGGDTVEDSREKASDVVGDAEAELEPNDTTDETKEKVDDTKEDGEAEVEAKEKTNDTKEDAEGKLDEDQDPQNDVKDKTPAAEDVNSDVENADGEGAQQINDPEGEQDAVPIGTVGENGTVIDDDKNVIGSVSGDTKKIPPGSTVDQEGDILDKDGNVIGQARPAEAATGAAADALKEGVQDAGNKVEEGGEGVEGADDDAIGKVEEGEGAAQETTPVDLSVLEGKVVNKFGNLCDENGILYGKLIEGDPKKLEGKKADDQGQIWSDRGKVIGRAEPVPEDEREALSQQPFEDFPGAVVQKNGDVTYEDRKIGELISGDPKKLENKKVEPSGEIIDKAGNTLGKAERWEEPEEDAPTEVDLSSLNGKRVNKAGNLVDEHGSIFGRVIEGDVKKMTGRMSDDKGQIWGDGGNILGKAELAPESEREGHKEGPFSVFLPCKVTKDGHVVDSKDVIRGRLTQGEGKSLEGHEIDHDGDVIDSNGNVLGKVERWEPEEKEKEKHPAAGLKVNTEGNVISDRTGDVIAKLTEGELAKCKNQEIDNHGRVLDSENNVLGRVTEINEWNNREHHPAAGLRVNSEGNIVNKNGETIAKLTDGELAKCKDHTVNDEGAVVDGKDNVLGHVTLIEEWKNREHHPAAGFTVNADGNACDSQGNVIAKLTSGELSRCKGQKVNDFGEIENSKGETIGWVTMIEDVKEEKPEKNQEELDAEAKQKEEDEEKEKDSKLAKRMAYVIDQGIEKVSPLLQQMSDLINEAEATPKEDLDEEQLVKAVKPLIEQASGVLNDTNSNIRSMDPDGRIQSQAKERVASGEASPEEHRVAELLKTLTQKVQGTIETCKRKLNGMPHAEKELSPLWGLLQEPLFQIIAAVGLLLSGVLGLLGNILGGLGLGGLLDGILGGLGIDKILAAFGVGGKKKKGSGGGGLGGTVSGIGNTVGGLTGGLTGGLVGGK